ncbi:hypothetical protein SERLA73DRAFT_68764 [Serpula lacrymans var. lacrymans S7.3]|uniref:Uncharacterized protein n=2 Tax=Serpula lacrymans var. lacrymans TaxID=341189 RepID=F8PI83_SERL3|nr:uncharacterized protein SERLADRAFT_432533 [Serpula lacrymans var. lacrymans S7.9]EGO05126.1 hypothetical protein SERLA73DRAFT_68764 [Serpula lacrymans var. lacrymans S7.3]EGO30881.1 hypothetical protein SERLADRAFT_432533 [Serpula lacrymans var. lacrymans S7.9]
MSHSTQPANNYNNDLDNLDKFDKNGMSGGPLTIKWTSEHSQEDANQESRKKGQAKSSKVTIHEEIFAEDPQL